MLSFQACRVKINPGQCEEGRWGTEMSPQQRPAPPTPPEQLSKQMLIRAGSSLLKTRQLWDEGPWMKAKPATTRRETASRGRAGSLVPDSAEGGDGRIESHGPVQLGSVCGRAPLPHMRSRRGEPRREEGSGCADSEGPGTPGTVRLSPSGSFSLGLRAQPRTEIQNWN